MFSGKAEQFFAITLNKKFINRGRSPLACYRESVLRKSVVDVYTQLPKTFLVGALYEVFFF